MSRGKRKIEGERRWWLSGRKMAACERGAEANMKNGEERERERRETN